jgi:hypothetical protein
MCSPAPVLLHDLEHAGTQSAPPAEQSAPIATESNSLRVKLRTWLAGWKQTLIAELASLGSPKEGFL